MRITGGIWRSRRLPTVAVPIRPTMDRVRKAIFDRLQSVLPLEGSYVADLFAGTGALGLEALSRGASFCVFVERDRRLLHSLRQTLHALGAEAERYRILADDVFRVSQRWRALGLPQLHLVFADPPYRQGLPERLLQALADADWLCPGGILCLELSRWDRVAHVPEGWQLSAERSFGETSVQWWIWHGTTSTTRHLPRHL
ncbi:MAG: 16S rRNA (guanine(966)-N(2))-methyltransferase RsmD [Chlorobiota bacterium]